MLLIARKSNETDLKYDMENVQAYALLKEQLEWPVVLLKPSYESIKTKLFDDAIQSEINGLLERGPFKCANRERLLCHANVLGERFLLSIQQPATEADKYKQIFIVQGLKEKEKKFIIAISRTVRHKNK